MSGRETVKIGGGGGEVRMMDEEENERRRERERERQTVSAPRRTDKGTRGRVNM